VAVKGWGRIVAVVAAYVVVGLLASRAARRAWSSVVDYVPPYRFDDAPLPTTAPLTNRLLLVLVDGLRLDASRELPTLNGLRARGADFECLAGIPSFSRPARATLATGAWPSLHGATTNFHEKAVTLDNVFRRASAAGLPILVAGSRHWKGLFRADLDAADVLEWRLDDAPGLFRSREADFQAFGTRALAALRSRPWRLAVVDLIETDDAAHDFGTGSEDYRRAARAVDARIGEMLTAADLATTTVIVTADHGHLASGGHGGGEAEVLETPLVLAGKGVRRGFRGTARQIDVGPTIAGLLGLPLPRWGQGRVRLDALEVDDAGRLDLLRAQERQTAAFAGAYAAALGAEPPAGTAVTDGAALEAAVDALDRHVDQVTKARQRADRTSRLPPFLLAALLPIVPPVTAALRRRWAGLAAVAAGVATGFAADAALHAVTGVRLSLSAINHENQLPGYFLGIMAQMVAALAAGLLVTFAVARRWAPDAASLCRLGLVVVGGVVSVLAILVLHYHWQHGLLLEWHLGDIDGAFHAFAGLVQIQAAGMGALVVPPLAWAFRRLAGPRPTP
jgi:hypothetical protein